MPFEPDDNFEELSDEEFLREIPEGASYLKPLQEEHPEFDRLFFMNFAYNTPQAAMEWARKRGFDIQPHKGNNYAIKKRGEADWHIVDPEHFEPIDDLTDIIGDIASGVGTGFGVVLGTPGGFAGMSAGGAAGAVATEGFKQGLGRLGGLDPSLVEAGKSLAFEGALGAATPAVDKALRAAAGPLKSGAKKLLGGSRRASAKALYALPDEAIRARAEKAGLPGAREYKPDELRKLLLERPSLTDDQLAREMDYVKGEYLTGRYVPDRPNQPSGEEFIPSKLQLQLAAERGAPVPTKSGEGIKARPGREAEIYKDILGQYEEAKAQTQLRRINPAEVQALGPEELTSYARARGIPTRASPEELRRGIFQMTGVPKIAALGANKLDQMSRALMGPSEKVKGIVQRYVAGRGALPTFEKTQALREQSAKAVRTYLDDVIGSADLDRLDDKGRDLVRRLMKTRDELNRTPTKTISGKEVNNFYQAVKTIKESDPTYNLGYYTENTPNELRKTLKYQFNAPRQELIKPDEGGGFGFYAMAMRDPALAGGIAGMWLADPISQTLLGVGLAGVGGKIGRRLAQTLANSADPLHLVLNSPTASRRTRALAQAAIEKWNRGDKAGYRAAVYVLLSKAAVRQILSEPEAAESYP